MKLDIFVDSVWKKIERFAYQPYSQLVLIVFPTPKLCGQAGSFPQGIFEAGSTGGVVHLSQQGRD
jgi:hypothetical protein